MLNVIRPDGLGAPVADQVAAERGAFNPPGGGAGADEASIVAVIGESGMVRCRHAVESGQVGSRGKGRGARRTLTHHGKVLFSAYKVQALGAW
jgi:hypothetical protein